MKLLMFQSPVFRYRSFQKTLPGAEDQEVDQEVPEDVQAGRVLEVAVDARVDDVFELVVDRGVDQLEVLLERPEQHPVQLEVGQAARHGRVD